MGVAWRLAKRAGVLALVILAATMALVYHSANRSLEQHAAADGLAQPVDAIIVLGGAIEHDGEIGYSSRVRVQGAVSLLAANQAERLILSGGPLPRSQAPPVSVLMRDFAINLGAPPEALIIEDKSVSTFENLRFSLPLAKAHGLERLGVLTESYHLQRARWLATYFGRPDIVPAAVPGLNYGSLAHRVVSVGREALAWWYNLYKVAAWEGLAALGMNVEVREAWIR